MLQERGTVQKRQGSLEGNHVYDRAKAARAVLTEHAWRRRDDVSRHTTATP